MYSQPSQPLLETQKPDEESACVSVTRVKTSWPNIRRASRELNPFSYLTPTPRPCLSHKGFPPPSVKKTLPTKPFPSRYPCQGNLTPTATPSPLELYSRVWAQLKRHEKLINLAQTETRNSAPAPSASHQNIAIALKATINAHSELKTQQTQTSSGSTHESIAKKNREVSEHAVRDLQTFERDTKGLLREFVRYHSTTALLGQLSYDVKIKQRLRKRVYSHTYRHGLCSAGSCCALTTGVQA